MKEIKLKGLDLSVYTEKLDNGLDVVFIPFKNKKNYFMSYATRFGSIITEFVPNNKRKMIKVPDGIAHFLEHKMFEQESGDDPFTFFSKTGTGANASTSFDSTQYICYGTKNFYDNLRYLISFVNSPYYTDQNVSKEKGIITEELKMYLDIPDFEIENRLRESIYKNHPRRIDIGGTVEEINKITKEDLYLCYNSFYIPSNMFILVAGNFDITKALEIVEDELGSKKRTKIPKIKKINEPDSVNIKESEVYSDINIPKLGFGIKIPTKNLPILDELELDLYLSILISIIFGSSSLFRERVRSKKLINSIYTSWETTTDHKVFTIISSTENIDELLNEIKYELDNISIDEDTFERIKKVWIANEVKIADHVEATINNIYDDMIKYRKVIPNRIDLIRKMKLKKLNDLISKMDISNTSVVKMLPNNK